MQEGSNEGVAWVEEDGRLSSLDELMGNEGVKMNSEILGVKTGEVVGYCQLSCSGLDLSITVVVQQLH